MLMFHNTAVNNLFQIARVFLEALKIGPSLSNLLVRNCSVLAKFEGLFKQITNPEAATGDDGSTLKDCLIHTKTQSPGYFNCLFMNFWRYNVVLIVPSSYEF
jgi:hypothetical protein